MLPGDELRVFARQRHVTAKGDGAAIFRQAREIRHQHVIGRRQHNHMLAAVVLVNAHDVEQVHGEVHKPCIVILFGDGVSELLGFFAAVGVDLQQAIAALFELRFQFIMLFAARLNEVVEALGVFRRGQITNQLLINAVVNRAAGRAGMLERVQAFVIPAHQHRLRGFSRYGTWI